MPEKEGQGRLSAAEDVPFLGVHYLQEETFVPIQFTC